MEVYSVGGESICSYKSEGSGRYHSHNSPCKRMDKVDVCQTTPSKRRKGQIPRSMSPQMQLRRRIGVHNAESGTPKQPRSNSFQLFESPIAETESLFMEENFGAKSLSDSPPGNPFIEKSPKAPRPSPLRIVREDLPLSEPGRFNHEFQELRMVGSGNVVSACCHLLDGIEYAVKQIDLSRRRCGLLTVVQEIYVIASLSSFSDYSSHIIRYYNAWREDEVLFLQTELCDCNLSVHLRRTSFHESELQILLKKALSYIHSHSIVHLDIKPENVFIHDGIYKLGDWGLATASSGDLFVVEGDSRYTSLELLQEKFSDLPAADIFSLGIMCFEIADGSPLPLDGDRWQDFRSGVIPTLSTISSKLNEILKRMMHSDPSRRPKASELLLDSYFSKSV